MIQRVLSVCLLILITNLIWTGIIDMRKIYHHFQKSHFEKQF